MLPKPLEPTQPPSLGTSPDKPTVDNDTGPAPALPLPTSLSTVVSEFTLPREKLPIKFVVFVGGSAPSFSERDGEGDQRFLFALPVDSLRLTNDPPTTA